ncbi:MAG: ABC transporter substrate-binding protein [Arachnia sp.]
MKMKGSSVSLALVLSGSLLLGACTSETGTETTGDATASDGATSAETMAEGDVCLQDVGVTATADGQVSFTAGPGQWEGYNNLTNGTYSTYNSVIADQMFSNFWYYGTDGTICENTEFGTFELIAEDPLEISYTIAEDAVWSDGTPVTINDFLLAWAAQNPEFLVPGYASGENPDATPLFDHVAVTWAEKVPDGPQGEVGAKEFFMTFDGVYPDYALLVDPPFPAHVVAAASGLEPDALAQAILDQDAETVAKVADFWNTGWVFNPGELPDVAQIPSSSRYKVKDGGWDDTSLTLEANDAYWGTPAATKNLVFRFIDDAAMAQALQNGDVDVIQPQPTVDTLGQLEAIGSAVTVETNSLLTWEHLDFNFRDTSAFADANGGLALREAFAMCVPRQAIVDTLIAPVAPDSVVMNAREVFPFQAEKYDEVVNAAYDGRFDQVDIEGATAKFEEAGLEGPVDVRLGYRSGNQRRTETVALIKTSCDQVGFNVIDASSEGFFADELVSGDYEVALYAWSGSGVVTSGQSIYATGKPQNYGEYSNPEVDAAWDTLTSTLDEDVHLEQVKIIEKALWDDLFGIPLYAHPGVQAYSADLSNVRATSAQSQISWNAFQWATE